MKSHFSAKPGFGESFMIGTSRESLTIGTSCEFQSLNNRMAILSCSDPAVMTLQLLACSTRVTPLTSHHSRVSHEIQLQDAL